MIFIKNELTKIVISMSKDKSIFSYTSYWKDAFTNEQYLNSILKIFNDL